MKKILGFILLTMCIFFIKPQNLYAETSNVDEDIIQDFSYLVDLKNNSIDLEAYSSTPLLYEILKDEVSVRFYSEDESIASIDTNGLVYGHRKGSTRIIMIAKYQNQEFENAIDVKVKEDQGNLRFKYNNIKMIRDTYYDLPYELSGGLKESELIWESSNPEVLTVQNGRIKANKIGTATVSVNARQKQYSIVVDVFVPLKEISFNPESLELSIGQVKALPDLLYIPYDSTNKAPASLKVLDENIVKIEDGKIIALKQGKTQIIAKVHEIETKLDIEVRSLKTKKGAEIHPLTLESKQDKQIFYTLDDHLMEANLKLALYIPSELILKSFETKDEVDLYIVLPDYLYTQNDLLEYLKLEQNTMELLKDKSLKVHLLDQHGDLKIIYELKGQYHEPLNLKFNFAEVDKSQTLFSNVKGEAFHLSFDHLSGFTNQSRIYLPSYYFAHEAKQIFFIYAIKDNELIDTNQEFMLSDENYLEFQLGTYSEYMISQSKLSQSDESSVIFVLSSILFIILLSIFSFYFWKSRKIR